MTDQLLMEAAAGRGHPATARALDFLVTEEQLGVTLLTAAIQNAPAHRRRRSFRCCATP